MSSECLFNKLISYGYKKQYENIVLFALISNENSLFILLSLMFMDECEKSTSKDGKKIFHIETNLKLQGTTCQTST